MINIVQSKTGKKNSPNHKHLVFVLNHETQYYEKTKGELGFIKVPNKLTLEIPQESERTKSEIVIQNQVENGKRQFFAGLIKTCFPKWYFCDFYEIKHGIKKNSFILFHLWEERTGFELFFFNLVKIYPNHRERFIHKFITSLKKENGAEYSHSV